MATPKVIKLAYNRLAPLFFPFLKNLAYIDIEVDQRRHLLPYDLNINNVIVILNYLNINNVMVILNLKCRVFQS